MALVTMAGLALACTAALALGAAPMGVPSWASGSTSRASRAAGSPAAVAAAAAAAAEAAEAAVAAGPFNETALSLCAEAMYTVHNVSADAAARREASTLRPQLMRGVDCADRALMQVSRRRDCHFANTPSPFLLKLLLKVGVQQKDSLADG